jgi:hypothetical protein
MLRLFTTPISVALSRIIRSALLWVDAKVEEAADILQEPPHIIGDCAGVIRSYPTRHAPLAHEL